MCLYIAGHQELLPLPHTQDRRGAVAADGSIWGIKMCVHRHRLELNHTIIIVVTARKWMEYYIKVLAS